MYPADMMNALRLLNWLDQERRAQTDGTAAAALVEQQQTATRGAMTESLVSFHDRFAARGKPSVVSLAGSSCSACHLKLPSGLLGELHRPGRYSMCPTCGVFVWSGEESAAEVAPVTRKSPRKKSIGPKTGR
jgi:predicted  nucleic acid-binding Zn-ribbon protein